ncbi:MAG: UvrD-helicase domain-containing protein [Desulfobacterales bacterium]|nr:UvrD-helicase domain-containing protein [Desulfobacterales bacterium]
MPFIADLHIHSKYSRATSRDLDLENLHRHALIKGIGLMGTGDFTHPAWMAEIEEKLIEHENGLFTLNPELEKTTTNGLIHTLKATSQTRFMLSSEISCIYKKDGATRKNHNLVFFPSVASAKAFNKKLDAIGNITSDGRPILGLDARDLLEIVIETDERGVLIPAHIWTPWFSMLGSKSGFDTLAHCFGDLSHHIFAGETGLSSDPPMNRRVSMLDGITLISNSDAHSPAKLGREANIFDCERSYDAIFDALREKGNPGFLGTLEFFPEEGKYHMDGHRNCGVRLEPEESAALNDLCPVCGKPMTLGVLHRVLELSDRSEAEAHEAGKSHPGFQSLIPLEEILSEIYSVGPKSKRVQGQLSQLISKLGPELSILKDLSKEELSASGIPLLTEAICRVREGRVVLKGGFDGEYGTVKVFSEEDKAELPGQALLFQIPQAPAPKKEKRAKKSVASSPKKEEPTPPAPKGKLNAMQQQAVDHPSGPLLIVAGPGTGKTHTITRRMAALVEKGIAPETILAITFTNRAAREMDERLEKRIGSPRPLACTFHALALNLLEEWGKAPAIADDLTKKRVLKEAIHVSLSSDEQKNIKPTWLSHHIEKAKQQLISPDDDLTLFEPDQKKMLRFRQCYSAYEMLLRRNNLMDFEGLIFALIAILESDPASLSAVRKKFQHLFIDEYQDLNHAQYRLTQLLAPKGHSICVIGDPDQAIYGFRGSSSRYFDRFTQDQPQATRIVLHQNYRSTQTILSASGTLLGNSQKVRSNIDGTRHLTIFGNASGEEEAVAIGKTIEKLVGGIGFHSMDFGSTDSGDAHFSFGDMAILTRTHIHGQEIARKLKEAGLPCAISSSSGLFGHPDMLKFLSALKLTCGCGSLMDLEQALPLFTEKNITFPLYPPISNSGERLGVSQLIANPWLLPESWCSHKDELCAILSQLLKARVECKNHGPARQIHCLLEELPAFRKTMDTDEALAHAIKRLVQQAEASPKQMTPARFLAQCALSREQDTLEIKSEKIQIMTLHASKGLEFPVVFIAGCEEGNIPFAPEYDDPSDLDEERRLFYVAMTRAKTQLFLSHAAKRLRFGEFKPCLPSSFLTDIETFLKKGERQRMAPKKAEIPKGPVQLSLF